MSVTIRCAQCGDSVTSSNVDVALAWDQLHACDTTQTPDGTSAAGSATPKGNK